MKRDAESINSNHPPENPLGHNKSADPISLTENVRFCQSSAAIQGVTHDEAGSTPAEIDPEKAANGVQNASSLNTAESAHSRFERR